ncbi:hypothetical protein [Deinococcus frigens]|uniref:hypothetical protein n=1 Tax=Deinococcus frigens TaxID=249403 RepID=UPI000494FDED|nr:hypothetical protein [Deinococcus frigens]
MLETFVRDVRGSRDGLMRAARRAYLAGLLALALPGVVLGAVFALTGPAPVPVSALLVLVGLALVLSLGALHFARKAAHTTEQPARQAALTGAIQAATAPGVPLLLACATLSQWLAVALFVVLAGAMHVLVWAQLPGWVREPEAEG